MADQTPAQELRAAATAMRERAQAAQRNYPAPWTVAVWDSHTPPANVVEDAEGAMVVGRTRVLHEHIAGMHPGVALAVADWLEAADKMADKMQAEGVDVLPPNHALKVARAYLGTAETEPAARTDTADA